MKIFVGTDHNGYRFRNSLVEHLRKSGHEVIDEGDRELDRDDDFPVFASKVVISMLTDQSTSNRGILICGSGQGMCMAANRYKGIRAALIYDIDSAVSSRNDDDSNVACIPASFLESNKALELIDKWLSTPFAGSVRFKRRIKELDELN